MIVALLIAAVICFGIAVVVPASPTGIGRIAWGWLGALLVVITLLVGALGS